MKKKYIIIVLLIIVLAVAAVAVLVATKHETAKTPYAKTKIDDKSKKYFAGKHRKPQDLPMGKFPVIIVQNTLAPAQLTIKKGQTVVWTNYDTVTRQIVSDASSSARFQSKVLSRTQSYGYVFNAAGVFPYHDALHPELTGTITVN